MTKRVIGALAALGVLSSGMAAYAVTETADMAVSAKIVNTCSISTTPTLTFDTVDATNLLSQNKSATIGVTCTATNAFTLTLSNGANFASSTRNLKGTTTPANVVPYKLGFDETNYAATSGELTTSGTTEKTAIVYGKIDAPQASWSPDIYTDTVVITLTYTPPA